METKKSNLKKRISNNWKDFFKEYTKPKDVAKITLDHSIGYNTLHNIKICNANISNEKNQKALYALAKVAIDNAKEIIKTAEKDIKKMEDSISEIIEP